MESSNPRDIVFNEEISVEFIENINKDISDNVNNITKYFNENTFNIFLFTLEENSDCSQIKIIILQILKAFVEHCKINSKVLMFNILECMSRNLDSDDVTARSVSESIMSEIVDNYDLFMTAGHHKKISQFVSLLLRKLVKCEKCDIGKIISFCTKYGDILWKFQKKNTISLLKSLSDKLILQNDSDIFQYVEAIYQLMKSDKLSLTPDSLCCRNISTFIFNALQEKHIQRCDVLLEKVILLSSVLLRHFSVDWIYSSNSQCKYNDSLFLRNFYLLFATIASFAMSMSSVSDKAVVVVLVNAVEALLTYLRVINESEDQQFDTDAEMLLVSILSKVNGYYEYCAEILKKVNANLPDESPSVDEEFFTYFRSIWLANSLLGKEVSQFIDNCGEIVNFVVDTSTAIIGDGQRHFDWEQCADTDQLLITESLHYFPLLAVELLHSGADESFVSPFLGKLFAFFDSACRQHFMGTPSIGGAIIARGLANFTDLLTESLSIVDDEQFFIGVDGFRRRFVSELHQDDGEHAELTVAIGRFLLEFYTHPAEPEGEGTIDNERVLDLLIGLARTYRKKSEDVKSDLAKKLAIFIDRYQQRDTRFTNQFQLLSAERDLLVG